MAAAHHQMALPAASITNSSGHHQHRRRTTSNRHQQQLPPLAATTHHQQPPLTAVRTTSTDSRVLELGIIVHSMILGLTLGASKSPKTKKPLIAALSFHQMFEGLGLGGNIFQAKIKSLATVVMGACFALTTPSAIVVGILVSNTYDENSSKALIIQGALDAAAAGILIYMALVDLLSHDFKSPRMQNNKMLLLASNISLFLGVGLMSLLAKWA